MPTYTQDFDYSLHTSKRITHKLKITEEQDLKNSRAKLNISIIRSNSGSFYYGESQYLKLKINGEVVFDGTKYIDNLSENASDEIFMQTHYVSYNSDGTGSFEIEATYKAEKISVLTDWIWGTTASATMQKSLTKVDLSPPIISSISVKADRYGSNAYASFKVSHSSYELLEVEFKLKGLTKEQAKCRDLLYDNEPPAYVNQNYNGSEDGSYYIRLIRKFPIGQSLECHYPLDDGNDGVHPLESGKSYPYEIIATAYNNKITTVTGTLKVPQKVTGITCESQLNLSIGQSTELECFVSPDNAEEKRLNFESSDPKVAMVDGSGVITAVAEGPCIITVTTVDGGFQATCAVNILDTKVFPLLEPIERYFTVNYFNRLIFATGFIKGELDAKSIAVSELEIISLTGRNEPVINILPALHLFKRNCMALKSATEESGIDCSSLPDITEVTKLNSGWIYVLNTWISFLNELHQLIAEV